MRTYDIDLTIHIRCCAHNEKEATDTVMERFRQSDYAHTEDEFLELKVKEVE